MKLLFLGSLVCSIFFSFISNANDCFFNGTFICSPKTISAYHTGDLPVLITDLDKTSFSVNILDLKKNVEQIIAVRGDGAVFYESKRKNIKSAKKSRIIWSQFSNLRSGFEKLSDLSTEKTIIRLLFMSSLGEILDSREVYADEDGQFNFSVSSCMDDNYLLPGVNIWKVHTEDTNLDAMYFIGDNVYADRKKGKKVKVTKKSLSKRYFETRKTLPVFRSFISRPVYATWDDHDYGSNNGGEKFKLKKYSAKIFRKYWRSPFQSPEGFVKGPGVSYFITKANQRFFFLDNRSFRAKKNPMGEHFGLAQKKWLFDNLLLGDNELNVLISGDQFFGNYHRFESYQGNHALNFVDFLKSLKLIKAKVVFLSGDRHLSEIMKIPSNYLGYETLEITSSGIHAKTYSGSLAKSPNELRVRGIDGVFNTLKLRLNMIDGKIRADAEVYGNKGIFYSYNWEMPLRHEDLDHSYEDHDHSAPLEHKDLPLGVQVAPDNSLSHSLKSHSHKAKSEKRGSNKIMIPQIAK